jgi:sugar phosphate isomerase/epimerase
MCFTSGGDLVAMWKQPHCNRRFRDMPMNRRRMLKNTIRAGTFVLAGTVTANTLHAAPRTARFTIDLVGGAIGVNADQPELIRLAIKHGFTSVQPNPHYLAGLPAGKIRQTVGLLEEAGIGWGSAGMPVEFRKDADKFNSDMKQFPKLAAALKTAGATRISTWLRPYHESLTWLANFKQHASRLREVCKVAGDNGLRFGVEYVGTKTLWTQERHPFIHTMAETKELISEVGQDNMGFVLDSWHWYTAGETANDIRTLTNKDVVACDLNDAPAGIPVDEQIDNRRELPAATGVIDVKSFLKALIDIGYDGPIRAEPFNQKLNAMDNEAACAATAKAIRKAFGQAGA